jgi:hypothetical protein
VRTSSIKEIVLAVTMTTFDERERAFEKKYSMLNEGRSVSSTILGEEDPSSGCRRADHAATTRPGPLRERYLEK